MAAGSTAILAITAAATSAVAGLSDARPLLAVSQAVGFMAGQADFTAAVHSMVAEAFMEADTGKP